MICCVRDRNAEALRTQSFRSSTSSALSASPRFKSAPSEIAQHGHVLTPNRTACAVERVSHSSHASAGQPVKTLPTGSGT